LSSGATADVRRCTIHDETNVAVLAIDKGRDRVENCDRLPKKRCPKGPRPKAKN